MIDPVSALKTVLPHLGSGAGAAAIPIAFMMAWATPADDFNMHVADSKVGLILQLTNDAEAEDPGPYKDALCLQLEEAIGEICANEPTHSMCKDRQTFREKAGCD